MCRCAAHNRLGELIKGIVGVGDGSCRRSFRQLIAIAVIGVGGGGRSPGDGLGLFRQLLAISMR